MRKQIFLLLVVATTTVQSDSCCWCGKRYYEGAPTQPPSAFVVDPLAVAVSIDKTFHFIEEVPVLLVRVRGGVDVAVGWLRCAVVADNNEDNNNSTENKFVFALVHSESVRVDNVDVFEVQLPSNLTLTNRTTLNWSILDSSRKPIKTGSILIAKSSPQHLSTIRASRVVQTATNKWIERVNEDGTPVPIFPYGWFSSWPLFEKDPDKAIELAAGNSGHPVSPFTPGGAARVKHILSLSTTKPWFYDMRHLVVNLTAVHDAVTASRDSPGILSWYLSDEPDGAGTTEGIPEGISAKAIRSAYDLVRSLDPFHFISLSLNCKYSAPIYAETSDLIMIDPYPISINTTKCSVDYGCCGCDGCTGVVTDVSDRVDFVSDLLSQSKLIHFVGQGFDGSGEHWKRFPTTDEFRVMSYLAVIHGASGGITYWIQDQLDSPLVQESYKLWKEFSTISEVALGPSSSRITVNTTVNSTTLHATGWCNNNKIIVAVANPSQSDHVTLSLLLSKSVSNVTFVEVAGQEVSHVTEVRVVEGLFRDSVPLAPFETRLFESRSPCPPQTCQSNV